MNYNQCLIFYSFHFLVRHRTLAHYNNSELTLQIFGICLAKQRFFFNKALLNVFNRFTHVNMKIKENVIWRGNQCV